MASFWKRVKTLGKGSFGTVSLASRSSDSNDVEEVLDLPESFAIKSCPIENSRSLQKERVLLHEFQGCPHVIRCYGADASLEGEEDGIIHYNLMLEYAFHGTLANCIYNSKHGLRVHQVRQYTTSLLSGLSYIHSKGFVHCDIKPDNILLVDDYDGIITAKISDFGLAKKVGLKRKRSGSRRREKGFGGTPVYMAPESILYGEYDCKADIWALGCTVIEMFTKQLAWDFDEKVELGVLLDRICNEEVEIPGGLSKDAEDFLKKCLIKNPELRWSAEMLLHHPFVSGSDKASVRNSVSSTSTSSEVSNVSSSCFDDSSIDYDDLIKPRFVLIKKVAGDSVSCKRGVVREGLNSWLGA
ncbi:hypothetical protein ACH5RR_039176 [Cinchona calisaya]|uniref:Protein kinase domain-containing protein n=1 Tax=Cinchona calisaya TaxID=153742 RepID=A0ABD2XY15_9GENT